MGFSSNKPSHLKALLKKNWILWKRSWIISLLEILIPILFAIIMFAFRQADNPVDVPKTTYYDNPTTLFDYQGILDSPHLKHIKDCAAAENGGIVALAPSGDSLVTKLNTILKAAGYTTYPLAEPIYIDLFTSVKTYASTPKSRLCFAIVINKNTGNGKYTYSLRFNTTRSTNPDLPSTSESRINQLVREDQSTLNSYANSGFLLLQNLVDNLIIQQETGEDGAKITSKITSRTVEAHIEDNLAARMKGMARLFFDLPLKLPYLRFINGIIREKESRIREGMKIMGLSNAAFYLSWFITYTIIFTVISFFISLLLVGGLFKLSSFGWVFLWHWEYCMCSMAMGFLITVFFKNAKKGNIFGFLISLILGFLQNAAKETSPANFLFRLSFAPPASLGLSGDHILNLEAARLGLTTDTVNVRIANYSITYHYIAMAFDIVIFILVGAYLDQVLKSEFGRRKHPLFCLKRKKSYLLPKKANLNTEENVLIQDNPDHFEEVEPSLKVQDETNNSIMIQNLKKIFPKDKTAVDSVSFNMYKNQIFALLGHNGAGKTTTISIITGLINATSGTAKVFGHDIKQHLDEIRKFMGVCPQNDILFDNLTVKEHLEMYAVFKGVHSKDIPQEVEKIISDIGLAEKRNIPTKKLSGGQKRRLSVGIAFIGGSKFILLDEPTSGMDTSARRKLWDMLKNYKHDRVILLTTHLMDEADYLGDRIGIMAEGRLRCLVITSPLHHAVKGLKTKFGIGYNLTIAKTDASDPSKPIIQVVNRIVPKSRVLSDVSNELAMQLPHEQTHKFSDLFKEFDTRMDQLKISSYGVSVTTLEEVFLNVAKVAIADAHYDPKFTPADLVDLDEEDFDLKEHKIKGKWEVFRTHFIALAEKRLFYFKRDSRSLISELLLPVLIVVIGIINANTQLQQSTVAIKLSDDLYETPFQVDYNSILPTSGTPISSIDADFPDYFNKNYFNMNPTSAADIAEFNTISYNDQGKDLLDSPINVFSVYMQNIDQIKKEYEYTAFINTRAQEGSAFAMNKINNAILKMATGDPDKQITTIVQPFLKTLGTIAVQNIYTGINYAFILSIGLSFIPGSLVAFIVKERESNAKHQQIVSGVSLPAYWLANYFLDYLKYLVPAVLNALLAMLFKAMAIIEDDKLAGAWTLFITYGLSMIPFTYLCSFLFKKPGNAQIAVFFFNFVTGFIGGLAISLLRLFDGTRVYAHIFQWILRPLPTFAMSYGFMNIANREVYYYTGDQSEIHNVFNINIMGPDVIFLIGTAILYLGLVFVVEFLRSKQTLSKVLSWESRAEFVPKKLDEDVEREIKEVEESDDQTYALKVDKLRKVYHLGRGKYKVAVDRLSFGVKSGECFALLGVNGAGKTTTFKILSGDTVQTSGKAFINGLLIPEQNHKARHSIGYCPQYDTILEYLTAKEHLFLYAALKGIPTLVREKFVERELLELNLKQYEDVPAGTLSGGNKRKLSVAIAIIGNPAIIFLDEPSTGMDPEARRFMWNVISRISKERKQSSVVLTTHSMEEAEALASRIGIMVNGNMQCLGTTQHIKNKYGGGYEIEVKMNLPTQQQIRDQIGLLDVAAHKHVDFANLDDILEKLNAVEFLDSIAQKGSGSAIYFELIQGKLTVELLTEWTLMEKDGQRLKDFFKENFGEMTVLENFQSFYRFKATQNITIGKFFGLMEENKEILNVLQYSIRQSTIEQIFNVFAAEEDGLLVDKRKHTSIEIDLGEDDKSTGANKLAQSQPSQ